MVMGSMILVFCSMGLWLVDSCGLIIFFLSTQCVVFSVVMATYSSLFWSLILGLLSLLGGMVIFMSFILMMLPNFDLKSNLNPISFVFLLMWVVIVWPKVMSFENYSEELLLSSLHMTCYMLCLVLLLLMLMVMLSTMNTGFKSIHL
uniref:NADH dehydrogenase subunit 6 n=1 Tax=Haematopinus quadripertusus TaxID=1453187 RepID=A0AAU7YR75_9NEOP